MSFDPQSPSDAADLHDEAGSILPQVDLVAWRKDASKFLTRLQALIAGRDAIRTLGLTDARALAGEHGSRFYAVVRSNEAHGYVKDAHS